MNYLLIGCLFFLACTNGTQKKRQSTVQQNLNITENIQQLLWGNKDVVDSTVLLEIVLHDLNNSRYKEALKKMSVTYPLDTFYFEGYYGFKIRQIANLSPAEKYVMFRINDYAENIWEDKLIGELFESLLDQNDRLFQLQMVESVYLGSKDSKDDNLKKDAVGQLENLLLEHPESKRVKYLLASKYLDLFELNKALEIFDQLIQQDYYALVSLKKILRFFLANENPLSKKYLQIMTNKFPQECKLIYSTQFLDTIGEPALIMMCNQCVQSVFQEDSMFAKILMGKFYLNKRQLNTVDSLYNTYEKNQVISFFDDNYLLERGLYYDLKLRSLFLQKKYNELVKFIAGIGANSVINIKNEEQFKTYIKGLYKSYFSQDTTGFKPFFEKSFPD